MVGVVPIGLAGAANGSSPLPARPAVGPIGESVEQVAAWVELMASGTGLLVREGAAGAVPGVGVRAASPAGRGKGDSRSGNLAVPFLGETKSPDAAE